ncbi:MAG: exodeoxyribonuclease VII small subunit [Bacteroidales bacterium]
MGKKKQPTYAEAIREIEEIIEKIESNELDVDNLSKDVGRVSVLIKFCKAKLKATEEEVEKILEDFDEE